MSPRRAASRREESNPGDSTPTPDGVVVDVEGEPEVLAPADAPPPIHLSDLKGKDIQELAGMARSVDAEGASTMRRQELIFAILQAQTARQGLIHGDGVLEVLPDGFGFLRSPDYSYLAGPDDIYVSPSQVKRFDLRTGDVVSGQIRSPKDDERYFALLQLDAINYDPPAESRQKVLFDNLTPLYPDDAIHLECGAEEPTGRVLDLMVPSARANGHWWWPRPEPARRSCCRILLAALPPIIRTSI